MLGDYKIVSEDIGGYRTVDVWIDECLNLNNKEDEMKMKGKVAKVEIGLVEIINGKLVDKTVFESSIQEIIEDERVVIAGGNRYENVYYLEIDGVEEFTGIYPELKVIDDRAKLAKLRKKMEGLSEKVRYELVWR